MTDNPSPWPAPTQATRMREFASKRRQTISGIGVIVVILAVVIVDEFVWNIPGI